MLDIMQDESGVILRNGDLVLDGFRGSNPGHAWRSSKELEATHAALENGRYAVLSDDKRAHG